MNEIEKAFRKGYVDEFSSLVPADKEASPEVNEIEQAFRQGYVDEMLKHSSFLEEVDKEAAVDINGNYVKADMAAVNLGKDRGLGQQLTLQDRYQRKYGKPYVQKSNDAREAAYQARKAAKLKAAEGANVNKPTLTNTIGTRNGAGGVTTPGTTNTIGVRQ